jgi:cysteine dioxygenase
MRILKGSLKETRYDLPDDAVTPPKEIRSTIYTEGEVTYMSDDLGVHNISNPDESEVAVSLHRKSLLVLSSGLTSW